MKYFYAAAMIFALGVNIYAGDYSHAAGILGAFLIGFAWGGSI